MRGDGPRRPLLDLFAPGVPVSYSTRGETAWKEALGAALPEPDASVRPRGLVLGFALSGPETGPHAPDLDNLCDPVLSVLINNKQWFGGNRSRIVVREQPDEARPGQEETNLDAVYGGPLPTSARDEAFAAWVRSRASRPTRADWYGVGLWLAGTRTNLGDTGTGPIKSLLDGLWPILGGRAGHPEDWRIARLDVSKGADALPDGAVRIAVFHL